MIFLKNVYPSWLCDLLLIQVTFAHLIKYKVKELIGILKFTTTVSLIKHISS